MRDRLKWRRLIPIIVIIIIISALVILLRPGRPLVVPDRVKREALKEVSGEVGLRNAFVEVAKIAGPSVASISTERTRKFRVSRFSFGRDRMFPFSNDPFDEFFRDFYRGAPEEYERKQAGLGSGCIIDKRGYILTNEHVVSGADKITVTLSDGRKFDGKVMGSDKKSDLAVINIDASGLPVMPLGNSDLVQTGEWVAAIGNPFGYIVDSPKPTVTIGVVSALHRSLPSSKSGYLDLIQTDAAINPGNSGGPLCDLKGNVIGINVAIFSTSGGHQGIGFAIPINLAKKIMDDLIKGKKITYPWLGIVGQGITEDLSSYFGLKDQKGILVAQIVKESPAFKAGLKEGDIIVKFDGVDVDSMKDLLVKINNTPVGKRVNILMIRDKTKIPLMIDIGEMPSEEEMARMEGKALEEEHEVVAEWRGMQTFPITQDLAARLDIRDREGVIVVNVIPRSPAYFAGLRPGDIIMRINNKEIGTIEDYKEAVKALKGNALIYTDRGFTIVKEDR